MTGLENITAAIVQQAHDEADKTLAEATARAERILAEQREAADAAAAEIIAAAEQKALSMRASTNSACALDAKNQLLAARLALINDCFDGAVQRLKSLSTNDYFNVIKQLVVAYAVRGRGELVLCSADLARCPSGFMSLVAAALPEDRTVVMSKTADDGIDGGCVLRYADIEINCSFAALVAAERERLIDEVNRILFN